MISGLSFSVYDRPFHLIVNLLVPGAQGNRYLIVGKDGRTALIRHTFHVCAIRWMELRSDLVYADLRALRLHRTPHYG